MTKTKIIFEDGEFRACYGEGIKIEAVEIPIKIIIEKLEKTEKDLYKQIKKYKKLFIKLNI
jgi:hypothetical protein